MIIDLIQRLKEENRWQVIVEEIEKFKKDIVSEMLNGEIRLQVELDRANAKLEAFDQIINLDKRKER